MVQGRPVVGSQVRLSFTVTDAAGAATNATTQVFTVTLPDGSAGIPPSVQTDGTGSYYGDYTVTVAGRHEWYATTTGPATRTAVNVFNAAAITAGAGPIVGLTEAKNHLTISGTGSDAELMDFLQRASAGVEQYTGCSWRRATVVETYDGGKTAIVLRQAPILSITTVTESGATLPASNYFTDANAGLLVRGSQTAPMTWLNGLQNVTVTYVVGPPGGVVPDDVIQGTLELLGHLWETQRGGSNRPRQVGTDSSPSGTGYSYPNRVRELLDPYVVPGIA